MKSLWKKFRAWSKRAADRHWEAQHAIIRRDMAVRELPERVEALEQEIRELKSAH
jgi:hypothetical protein